MKGAQAMLKPRVIGSGINKTCQAKLFNVPKPLKPWVLNYIEDYIPGYAYKSIDRIIYYFAFIGFVGHLEDS
jgi:hypothetical protein